MSKNVKVVVESCIWAAAGSVVDGLLTFYTQADLDTTKIDWHKLGGHLAAGAVIAVAGYLKVTFFNKPTPPQPPAA